MIAIRRTARRVILPRPYICEDCGTGAIAQYRGKLPERCPDCARARRAAQHAESIARRRYAPKGARIGAPTWRTSCDVCGASIELEVRGGRVSEYCPGCARNAERRALGLPDLSHMHHNAHPTVETRERPRLVRPRKKKPRPAGPGRPRRSVIWRHMRDKLPRYAETACTMSEMAAALDIKRSYAQQLLRTLRAEGIAECREGRHPVQHNRVVLLWWRVDIHKERAA